MTAARKAARIVCECQYVSEELRYTLVALVSPYKAGLWRSVEKHSGYKLVGSGTLR